MKQKLAILDNQEVVRQGEGLGLTCAIQHINEPDQPGWVTVYKQRLSPCYVVQILNGKDVAKEINPLGERPEEPKGSDMTDLGSHDKALVFDGFLSALEKWEAAESSLKTLSCSYLEHLHNPETTIIRESTQEYYAFYDYQKNEFVLVDPVESIKINKPVQRMYSEAEVKSLLIDCKNRFGGSELQDYVYDEEVITWFENQKKYNEQKIKK